MDNNASRELLLEHYKSPANLGKPSNYSHEHKLVNRNCGDEIIVYLSVVAGKLEKVNYEVTACALCTASASILSEELAGQDLSHVEKLEQNYLEELLGSQLSINRVKCALLPLRAIQQAAGLREKASNF